ncbi:MAG: amidohydrolase family protein [bacterium]
MRYISIPYLHDHHSHFSLYAGLANSLNIKEKRDKNEVLDILKSFPDDKLNVVYGWNSGSFRFSDKELESLPPVLIANLSLHGFVLNGTAKKMLRDEYPEIIKNYKDTDWCEEHLTELVLFFSRILPTPFETVLEYAKLLETEFGIYETEDMLLPSDEFYKMIENSELSERVFFWADLKTFKTLSKDTHNKIKGIKLFTDGANGAATAAMAEPYKTGEKGFLTYSDKKLTELMEESLEISNAVAIHAIGDRAIDQIISATEILRRHNQMKLVRIEHCQFIFEKSAKKARDLGITLSLQPNFNEDSVIYSDRIPEKYVRQNNPFRMLIDKAGFVPGKDLILGSDGMPHGVEFALEQCFWPPFPVQNLKLSEFVDGYCMKERDRFLDLEIDEHHKKIRISRN